MIPLVPTISYVTSGAVVSFGLGFDLGHYHLASMRLSSLTYEMGVIIVSLLPTLYHCHESQKSKCKALLIKAHLCTSCIEEMLWVYYWR